MRIMPTYPVPYNNGMLHVAVAFGVAVALAVGFVSCWCYYVCLFVAYQHYKNCEYS